MADIDIEDGDTITITPPVEFRMVCCDCMLTHKVKARKSGEDMLLTFWRNEDETTLRRINAKKPPK